MKKTFYLLGLVIIGAALLASCKSGTQNATAASTDSVSMPYKASYSSSFTISNNAKYEQAVLQSYKDWEDNKLTNAPAYFADTIAIDFSDGTRFKLRRDSAVHLFQKYRDSLSSSKIEMVSILTCTAQTEMRTGLPFGISKQILTKRAKQILLFTTM